MESETEMMHRLLRPRDRTRASKTIEVFGWILIAEGFLVLLAPHFVISLLHLPSLTDQAAIYCRLIGLMAGGIGMLYIVSGRLDADGFTIASLLDRPLVPPIMALLWFLEIVPAPLAILYSVQDFGGFLWTLMARRADLRAQTSRANQL